ncbi:hypothetical protein EYF80_023451 [Liparis tanakae]|uniref:Uncharacterized protein n=1 Tax=Liparis tanakae TaxID=230148 RepID=A0A4Z2HM13_9TELE|nr:hypothetical protein EYF80_023451 [Liparis tanakae]
MLVEEEAVDEGGEGGGERGRGRGGCCWWRRKRRRVLVEDVGEGKGEGVGEGGREEEEEEEEEIEKEKKEDVGGEGGEEEHNGMGVWKMYKNTPQQLIHHSRLTTAEDTASETHQRGIAAAHQEVYILQQAVALKEAEIETHLADRKEKASGTTQGPIPPLVLSGVLLARAHSHPGSLMKADGLGHSPDAGNTPPSRQIRAKPSMEPRQPAEAKRERADWAES